MIVNFYSTVFIETTFISFKETMLLRQVTLGEGAAVVQGEGFKKSSLMA